MKNKYLLSLSLISLLLLGGCGSHQANSTTKASAKKDTTTKVTHKKKKPAEPKKSTAENNQQANNAAADKPVQKTNAAPQPPKTPAMNLNEIKNGSYASIVGNWKEVATRANHQDMTGSHWGPVNPDDKITISNSQIVNMDCTLSGNMITGGNNQSNPAQFRMDNGALEIMGDAGAASVSFSFYPKGIALSASDWGDDIPEVIKTNTERIVLRSSNNDYIQVYTRV